MCIRFLCIVFSIIITCFNLFAHDQGMHQYITRQAFLLLQKSFPSQLSDMENYIGNNEVWSGSGSDGSFGALRIVSGAWLEDEYDVVYHYGLIRHPNYNQSIPIETLMEMYDEFDEEEVVRKAYTSITHLSLIFGMQITEKMLQHS